MNIFKVEKNTQGNNWLIANCGDDMNGNSYYVTTNQIHGTQLYHYSGGAKADAELICKLLNKHFV